MYRDMRRTQRQLSDKEAMEILRKGEYGILATVGKDGQPYGVPLSYAVSEKNSIYFHCAYTGHKIENIQHHSNVTFTVVGDRKPIYKNLMYTTDFESVIVFGNVIEITDKEEKIYALTLLCNRYLPEHNEFVEKSIERSLERTMICKIIVEHITGKAKKTQ